MASVPAGSAMGIGDLVASVPMEKYRIRDPYDSFGFATDSGLGALVSFDGPSSVAGTRWARNLSTQFQPSRSSRPFGRSDGDAYSRMFGTQLGQSAVNMVGNESETLAQIGTLATETLAASLILMPGKRSGRSHGFWEDENVRTLVVPPAPYTGLPPTLLVLDPNAGSEPERVTSELGVVPELLGDVPGRLGNSIDNEHGVGNLFFGGGPEAVLTAMWISRPEVIVMRAPQMIRLACPSPALEVLCGAERSSIGIFCRDSDGVAGATACLHGTGWLGTAVTMGGMPTVVKHANAVQDIVFLPLPDGYVVPNFAKGIAGVRRDRAPARNDPATFDGCTSGERDTVVSSHDAGLLRIRSTIQLKVQTAGDVNRGDSGSALLDEHDRVMAFAFERTDYDQRLQFADWIWAANALDSLGLKAL